jgi:hypothetical protein
MSVYILNSLTSRSAICHYLQFPEAKIGLLCPEVGDIRYQITQYNIPETVIISFYVRFEVLMAVT